MIRATESAALGERGVAEIVGLDGARGGDVVADEAQPGELFLGEGAGGLPFAGFDDRVRFGDDAEFGVFRVGLAGVAVQPGVEAFADGFGEGAQVGFLLQGEAHEGDEVGEATGLGAAEHAVGRGGGVGGPKAILGEVGSGVAKLRFEGLEHGLVQALGVGARVEDAQGVDLGVMELDEFAEGAGEGGALLLGGGIVAGVQEGVGGVEVDGLLVVAAGAGDGLTEIGIVERQAGFERESGAGGCELFLRRFGRGGVGMTDGLLGDGVEVGRVEERGGDLTEGFAAGEGLEFGEFRRRERAFQPGEAGGEGDERVLVAHADGDIAEEFFQGDAGSAVERAGVGFAGFADANGIDDDEVGLGFGVGAGNGLEVGGRKGAGASSLHLLKVVAAAGVAQEEQAFEGFDVGASGDHVHRDGDAQGGRGAELADEFLGLRRFAGDGVLGLIGDLFGEVVSFAEHFADEVHGVFGVGVVLAENEGLRDHRATGEKLGAQGFAEGGQDGADLVANHDGAVEVGRGKDEVVLGLFPAHRAGGAGAFIDEAVLLDGDALLGDSRADTVDIVADIHAVGHGALVAVLHDEVFVEEADGVRAGCGGEADEEGVEVFEHLAPQSVDGAVTFVGDEEVEEFRGDRGIVGDFARGRVAGVGLGDGMLVGLLVEFLSAQHGVESLDRADHDLGGGVEFVRGEMLNDVELGELATGVGVDELLELGECLAAEVGSVDEEEDALGAGVLDEPVGEAARGESFAGASGHLDERARAILSEGLLQVRDGLVLAVAEVAESEFGRAEGEGAQTGAQGVRPGEPRGECLGAMEIVDAARARLGVAVVAEVGLDAGRFVDERERTGGDGGERFGQVRRVVAGLIGHAGKGDALFFRLDDTDGLPVDDEQVVTRAGFQRHFAKDDTARRAEVQFFVILHDPAGGDEIGVDGDAGFGFRGHSNLIGVPGEYPSLARRQ